MTLRISAAILILACGAAEAATDFSTPRENAPQKKDEATVRWQTLEAVFWKVVDAAKDPEFELWFGGPGLDKDPRFEYDDSNQYISFQCNPWGTRKGGTPALAIFCDKDPVIAYGRSIFKFGINKDGWAWLTGHELSHLLLRHGQRRLEDHKIKFKKWDTRWLSSQAGAAWREKIWETIETTFGGRSREARDQLYVKTLLEKFYDSSEGKDYLSNVREQEAEADIWATKLTALAGYDRMAGRALWEKLQESRPVQKDFSRSTHYPPDMRAWEQRIYSDPQWVWVPPETLMR